MNATLRTTLIVLGVIIVAAGLFIGGTVAAGSGLFWNRAVMPGSAWNDNFAYGPGMMNGGRGDNRGGPGMMFGRGYDRVGPGMMGGRGNRQFGVGPGMMGNYGWGAQANATVTPLTVEQARQAADKYVQSLNLQGLQTGEVMIFDKNAYVEVQETATGVGAFELLVDPVSQSAYPEPGANMMWNLKYGALNHTQMMGGRGMMGLWNPQNATPADVSADMPVTAEQALKEAQAYLNQYQSGATAATDALKFYGYYTIDFSKDGKIVGMLSINGYNGQVLPHVWHGSFVEEGK